MKLFESSTEINTEYGKLYINKDVPFEKIFNGTTFHAYHCGPNSVAGVEIGYDSLIEFVEIPCEDIAIKKAICRLGADSVKDCTVSVDITRDISDELSKKISEVEKTKDLFGLNNLLKTEVIFLKQESPISISNKEASRVLDKNGFTVSEDKGCITVFLDGNEMAKIFDNGMISAPSDTSNDEYFKIKVEQNAVK